VRYHLYDPKPTIHDYLSPMYFDQMEKYAKASSIELLRIGTITEATNCVFICNADYLDPVNVSILKNNGCKIVGFSVTDSSWVSQCCREANHLKNIDLMFMLTGIQKVNTGHEMIVNPDFTIGLELRQFLPEEDWEVFNAMRLAGRLQSLPYVHAERQPHVDARPYSTRNQQVLIRGGHHMRRFILALKLLEIGRLDCNSGFVTEAYFQDSMNPQFRYCDTCRAEWRINKRYPWSNRDGSLGCCNENDRATTPNLSDLGSWNNKCPQSFYNAAARLSSVKPEELSRLLNARWLTQQQHLEMLARITFTSDLKWLFSIYAAQRFWDAASVGCINLLPSRTADQDYFPKMEAGVHYQIFDEHLAGLEGDSTITETGYGNISRNAKALYDDYMRPTNYAIGTPILKRIFNKIEEHTA
jgi:hypothetical protein